MSSNRLTIIISGMFFLLSGWGLALRAQEIDHWETLIIPGRQCTYLVPEGPVDPDWTLNGFDDSDWLTGTGGVGFGDNDDNTTIDPALSVYCRYDFTLSNPGVISEILLDMDFDDGFVAYLNGTELARDNMGEPGSITSWDQAASGLQEALVYQGITPMRFILDESVTSLLVSGDNTFAVEVHNESLSSSDLSSNPYLHVGVNTPGNYFLATPDWFYPPSSNDSSLLPLVVIDTEGQSIPDDPRITARMKVIHNDLGLYNHSTDPGNVYDGWISIETRGESSQWYSPKDSYSLETQSDSGTNNNVSILGLPEENDWVLYAPYTDKSLLRNVITYRLFAEMGHYSPRTRFVEVVLNNDYRGIYILTEKIKRDRNRVDMAKLLPEDIAGDELTGGYLLRKDKLTNVPETHYWESPVIPPYPDYLVVTYQYYDPKYEELNDIQRSYIQDYLLEFETAMVSSDFRDPDRGYRAYLDIPSFVDLMILNEFTKDVDGFRLSHYFYKEKDSDGGKLVSGPPWDYNLTFGNSDYTEDMHETYNWIHTYPITIYWWARAMEDPWFRNQLRCRWETLHQTILSSEHLHGIIDSAVAVMGEAIPRNYERWPILGTYIWPNSFVGQTYSEEEWFLRNWIDDRLEWMDGQWGDRCWPLSDNEQQLIPLPGQGRVYPNPSDLSGTFVELDSHADEALSFRLFDMSGRIVRQDRAYYSGSAFAYALPDMSDLPPGIYTLEVSSPAGERGLFKLIRQ